MPTNVMFAKDVSPVCTIDLGSAESIAAAVVHAGAELDWRLTHPDSIVVETSLDGKTFTRAGTADWKQVFDPPADFASWELEEASEFAGLPAGGRLAYAFRILFEKPVQARYVRVTSCAQKGWGMLLSEIQVYDKVTVERNVPPLVALPPVKGGK
jgi:hypothetical protein